MNRGDIVDAIILQVPDDGRTAIAALVVHRVEGYLSEYPDHPDGQDEAFIEEEASAMKRLINWRQLPVSIGGHATSNDLLRRSLEHELHDGDPKDSVELSRGSASTPKGEASFTLKTYYHAASAVDTQRAIDGIKAQYADLEEWARGHNSLPQAAPINGAQS